jgi:hypothetical protein
LVLLCGYLRTACLGKVQAYGRSLQPLWRSAETQQSIPTRFLPGWLNVAIYRLIWLQTQLVFNDCGELLNLLLTPRLLNNRKPVQKQAHQLFGKSFGDKGCLSKALRGRLLRTFGVEPATRSNMKNMPVRLMDKILMLKLARNHHWQTEKHLVD